MSGTGRRCEPTDGFGDLYRASEALLETLGLARSFTLDDLHRRIEERRGRPVHLIARDLPALAPHGLWVAGEHADYVFYDKAAAPVRQHQIIGHELGHMLHDDDGAASAAVEEVAAALLPDVVPGGPARVYRRSSYDEPAERRAEVFATVVVQRVHSWLPLHPARDADVVARVSAALRGDRET
jgi:hypothetical protein